MNNLRMNKEANFSSEFGNYNLFQIWTSRLILIGILAVVLSHYNENPNGLTILALLILIIISVIKTDNLNLYDEHLEVKRNFCLDLVSRKTVYKYTDILDIQINGSRNLKDDIMLDVIALFSPIGMEKKNYISITTNKGKTNKYRTIIYRDELDKVNESYKYHKEKLVGTID